MIRALLAKVIGDAKWLFIAILRSDVLLSVGLSLGFRQDQLAGFQQLSS